MRGNVQAFNILRAWIRILQNARILPQKLQAFRAS